MENKEEVKYNFIRGGGKDFDGFDIDIKQSEYDSKDFIIFIGTDEFDCATASIPKTEISKIKTALDEIEGVKPSTTIQDKETINLFEAERKQQKEEFEGVCKLLESGNEKISEQFKQIIDLTSKLKEAEEEVKRVTATMNNERQEHIKAEKKYKEVIAEQDKLLGLQEETP